MPAPSKAGPILETDEWNALAAQRCLPTRTNPYQHLPDGAEAEEHGHGEPGGVSVGELSIPGAQCRAQDTKPRSAGRCRGQQVNEFTYDFATN